jgi:hypothetical protein
MTDDVDMLRAGEAENSAHERAQVGTFASVECASPERFVGDVPRSHWSPW